MASRILTCPRSKMISGVKSWFGFNGFNFPGWAGVWLPGDDEGFALGIPNGSWISGGPDFVVNDLVLVKVPAWSGNVDGTAYPAVYFPFRCKANVTGAADPLFDATHFEPWNYGAGTRQTWPDEAHKYLEFTAVTEFANFPFGTDWAYDSSGSRHITPSPADSAAGHLVAATDGTFTEDWTYADHFAAGAAHTGPGSPSGDQSPFLWPNVPPLLWFNGGSGGTANVHSGTAMFSTLLGTGTWGGTAPLISWNFTGTSLEFVFAAWGLEGSLLNPPLATITQTVTLATEYLLTDAQDEAAALLEGTTFEALDWNKKAACSYNTDGTIAVAVTGISGATAQGTTCVSGVLHGPNANAATGLGFNQGGLSLSKAQVDVCGSYHVNTFDCAAATITAGDCEAVDGFAPVTIDPPASDGNPVYRILFPGC